MSLEFNRAHFQFRNEYFVVVVINVLLETVEEFINCLKMFAVEHFDFKSAKKVFHSTVIHNFPFRDMLCLILFSPYTGADIQRADTASPSLNENRCCGFRQFCK